MENEEQKSSPQSEPEDLVELGEVSKDTKGFIGGKFLDGGGGYWE